MQKDDTRLPYLLELLELAPTMKISVQTSCKTTLLNKESVKNETPHSRIRKKQNSQFTNTWKNDTPNSRIREKTKLPIHKYVKKTKLPIHESVKNEIPNSQIHEK
jgi:hypothetical protein